MKKRKKDEKKKEKEKKEKKDEKKEVEIFSVVKIEQYAFSVRSKISAVVITSCLLMFYVVIDNEYSTHCLHTLHDA